MIIIYIMQLIYLMIVLDVITLFSLEELIGNFVEINVKSLHPNHLWGIRQC